MSDQLKFTPGPWRIGNLASWDGYTGKPYRNVWAGDDDNPSVEGPSRVIARAIESDDVDANARLIAAAPDLLAACMAVFRNGEAMIRRDVLDGLRDAIEKATGTDLITALTESDKCSS